MSSLKGVYISMITLIHYFASYIIRSNKAYKSLAK
jgi:hypothetical protein